jgi:hypothetical protein
LGKQRPPPYRYLIPDESPESANVKSGETKPPKNARTTLNLHPVTHLILFIYRDDDAGMMRMPFI